MRVLHNLGSFSKGDINVWDSLKIFILRSKIIKNREHLASKVVFNVYFECFTFTAFKASSSLKNICLIFLL